MTRAWRPFLAAALCLLSAGISAFNENGWHWAFYAFREDSWDGMDYELGTGKAGGAYWKAIEDGRLPGSKVYRDNPLSGVLKRALFGR